LGETSIYTVEVPVACSCQWLINLVPQPETGTPLVIQWQSAGLKEVVLNFLCTGGQAVTAGIIETIVYNIPQVDLGNDTAIMQGEQLLLDAGNPGSHYLWNTGDTTQTILVSMAGTYSVTVSNPCGTDWDDIVVSVFISIEEFPGTFDGQVYFDGSDIRISPGSKVIDRILVYDVTGRELFEGSLTNAIRPRCKGLHSVILHSGNESFIKKLVIY